MRVLIRRNAGVAGLLLVALGGTVCLAAPPVLYCDARATGANNGSSWTNAFLCLQDALRNAGSGTEIRIALGTYKPDRRSENWRDGIHVVASGRRTDSFTVTSGMALRGGYAGTGAADPDLRDIDTYKTILSGDLAGNDLPLMGHDWQSIHDFVQDPSRNDNSQSVVTVSVAGGSAVLDGLTISGGHAGLQDGAPGYGDYYTTWPDIDGAGVFLASGSPSFVHCTFRLNTTRSGEAGAAGGAGVLCLNASPTFSQCLFKENIAFGAAGTGLGGAIRNIRSNPTLIDCTFLGNVASGIDGQYLGGAIANIASSPTLTNCLFRANMAVRSKGGAIYNHDQSNPTLTDCVFEGNLADYGGAICSNDSSSPTLVHCTFSANQANYGRGGALFNGTACGSTITECLFLRNIAANEGGAVCGSGHPLFLNCLFSGNTARNGAAMFIEPQGNITITNCTITGNQAEQNGGALYGQQSTATVTNGILWADGPQEVYLENGTAEINYSDIEGVWTGAGNIHAEPRFLDPIGADGAKGTADDDLRLSMSSPALDAGNNAALPPSAVGDLDGKSRIANARVDMGAYEFNGPFCYFVDAATGSDTNGGWGPREAFATIQRGINAARAGYTVAVAPGLYREDIDFKGKAVTVTGWNGAPTLEAPDEYAVSFYTAEGPGSILKNFVITHSDVGVFIAGSSPTICNVTLVGNDFGIAAYAGARPDIVNCVLWDNANGDLFGCTARFSCTKQGLEGLGNISDDPLFADAEQGDYHLRSEKGRYVSAYGLWAFDDETSPCIDAGDPAVDASAERNPNGARVNMGAFGGTAEASMSDWPLAGDLNHDGVIDFTDLAILADGWLSRLQAP